MGHGAPDVRNPHALGVYLLSITPTDVNPAEPFETEFKVVNTWRALIQVPVSPHLSYLQPTNESVAFTYLSMALLVRVEDLPSTAAPAVGFLELYGAPEDAGTVISLMPGEWIRVRARVRLTTFPLEPASVRRRAGFWLRTHFGPFPADPEITNLAPCYPDSAAKRATRSSATP